MKIIGILVSIAVVGILALTGYAHSGMYDVSASSHHSGITQWFLSTMSHASIEKRSRGIAVPDLDDDELVLAGVNDFNSMCTSCHGAPGKEPEAVGLGLNPPAPNLAHSAEELTPAELFWVTKHGIKMTGMPSWGATHDDDSIWPVVAFMMSLPGLDSAGYQELLSNAAGHGHHADDAADDGHSHVEGEDTSESNVHVHDDGTEHIHETPPEKEAARDGSNDAHIHENQ